MNKISKTTLGDLIEFQRGYDLPKSDFKVGKVPVISSNGILGYHNQAKVKGPGITIGRSGTVGLPHYINEDFFPHNTALFIKDFKGNYPKYIFYLLKTLSLNDRGSGSGVPTMNRNHLHPLKVSAHLDFNTQQKIASVLSALDSKIELNNRINAELEAMAKTLYDYWFVQFDFPDKNGKPYNTNGGKMVWNEELKREVPEGWEVKRIGDFGEFKNGINYDPSLEGNTDAKIINVRNISSSNLFVSQFDLDTIRLQKSNVNNYLVTEKDILIARSGIPGATRMMFEFAENTIYCGFIIRFQVNNVIEKNYLFYFLKDMEKNTTSKSGGTIMPNVNQDTMKRMLVIEPNVNVVIKFNEFINPIFKKMNGVIQENQKLTELRDWLLPMLMNGQVKVSDVEDKVELRMAAEPKIKYGK